MTPDRLQNSSEVLRLRIELEDIEPLVWRILLVPASYTFMELHAAIQGAMGWADYHLYRFQLNGTFYERLVRDEEPLNEGARDVRQHFIGANLKPGCELSYEYDMGDSWLHSISVEGVEPAAPRGTSRWPRCVAGENACPPEDCGGPPGYAHLLEVLNDPEHEEFEDLSEWAGGHQPHEFNTAQANKLIQAICALYRKEFGCTFPEPA